MVATTTAISTIHSWLRTEPEWRLRNPHGYANNYARIGVCAVEMNPERIRSQLGNSQLCS